jgi:transposase
MVRASTPEDEDRRRICRERKVLIMERVQHVNRIKGLLFSQGASGYEPLRRDRRARLDALQTGDGRRLPPHLKAQVCRELDRLELLLRNDDQVALSLPPSPALSPKIEAVMQVDVGKERRNHQTLSRSPVMQDPRSSVRGPPRSHATSCHPRRGRLYA